MSAITRQQAYQLVSMADELVGDLIPDYDLKKVDKLQWQVTEAIEALAARRYDDAARAAALVIAIMAGTDSPNQKPPGKG